ncbi:hypothetical protein RclHR1_12480003 [Rhizophagus clarus]|uniref:Uncharacterized protein n=1 Tax=Rhizophagus clarus TaxID=94130 RepID=A0A2Z6QJQ1_9GLOM|nr:hypothetical protein RclHR1_12480003 [Rhizophagus clarus]
MMVEVINDNSSEIIMEEDNITNIEEKFNDVSDNKETDMKRSKSYWNLLEELNKPIFKKNVEEKEESNDQKTLVQLIEKVISNE